MVLSILALLAGMGAIFATVLLKGLPSLNWAMLIQPSNGGYYLGKNGGIANAILGSIALASGGTALAMLPGIPIALFLRTGRGPSGWAKTVRLALDILCGIPSIVYGALGFALMTALGLRASLLAGILTLALLELPIFTRAFDEVVRIVPLELDQASLGLGATALETKLFVLLRQVLPGLASALQLAFGRAIGDAASVMFTAGYTDRNPTSLFQPVASLPLAVFFQLNTPYPEVQGRAYASALVLTALVLLVSLASRLLAGRLSRYTIR
jgi:phosphate transport system permease protein